MHERGKEQQEVDGLRKLAELLRQAHSAAANGDPNEAKPADAKKLRRRGKSEGPYSRPIVRAKS